MSDLPKLQQPDQEKKREIEYEAYPSMDPESEDFLGKRIPKKTPEELKSEAKKTNSKSVAGNVSTTSANKDK